MTDQEHADAVRAAAAALEAASTAAMADGLVVKIEVAAIVLTPFRGAAEMITHVEATVMRPL